MGINKAKWLNVDVPQPPDPGNSPAILLYDLETTPEMGWTWGKWKQNVIRNWKPQYILSVAYRWWHPTDPSPIYYHALTDDPKFRPDHPWTKPRPTVDRYNVARLWRLFDMADATMAHNGDRFDWGKTNGRISLNGAPPPSPAKQIDTVKEYRRYFQHASNSLDDLARRYGWGSKQGHSGIDTWFGAMAGEQWAVDEMREYNIHDVELLTKAFEQILPWIGMPGKANPLPNWGHWIKDEGAVCKRCGSTHLQSRGFYEPSTIRYRKWQCMNCGGYDRSRYGVRERGPKMR